ncbi:MAG: hypothetical protein N6V49_06195, partial [Serratia symbiotica]|nr:hypothetical protein [Serratia symbiotica]
KVSGLNGGLLQKKLLRSRGVRSSNGPSPVVTAFVESLAVARCPCPNWLQQCTPTGTLGWKL